MQDEHKTNILHLITVPFSLAVAIRWPEENLVRTFSSLAMCFRLTKVFAIIIYFHISPWSGCFIALSPKKFVAVQKATCLRIFLFSHLRERTAVLPTGPRGQGWSPVDNCEDFHWLLIIVKGSTGFRLACLNILEVLQFEENVACIRLKFNQLFFCLVIAFSDLSEVLVVAMFFCCNSQL